MKNLVDDITRANSYYLGCGFACPNRGAYSPPISDLVGKTIKRIAMVRHEVYHEYTQNLSTLINLYETDRSIQADIDLHNETIGDFIMLETECGQLYLMFHERCCSESVDIDDISGELIYLIGTPILNAEVITNHRKETKRTNELLWTFYKIETIKGNVTLRWEGQSNGYYSIEVDFANLKVEEMFIALNDPKRRRLSTGLHIARKLATMHQNEPEVVKAFLALLKEGYDTCVNK